jgi:hypothetical protein
LFRRITILNSATFRTNQQTNVDYDVLESSVSRHAFPNVTSRDVMSMEQDLIFWHK